MRTFGVLVCVAACGLLFACSSSDSSSGSGGKGGTGGTSSGGTSSGGTSSGGTSSGGTSSGGTAGTGTGGTSSGGTAGASTGGAAGVGGGGGAAGGAAFDCTTFCKAVIAAKCTGGPTQAQCEAGCNALKTCTAAQQCYACAGPSPTVQCGSNGAPTIQGCATQCDGLPGTCADAGP